MPTDRMRYVFCYDVPNDRRRTKLAKFLDGYGERVQYSVFEAVLDRALFDNLMDGVRAMLVPEEDRFRVYVLCAGCDRRRVRLGKAEAHDVGTEVVFIV